MNNCNCSSRVSFHLQLILIDLNFNHDCCWNTQGSFRFTRQRKKVEIRQRWTLTILMKVFWIWNYLSEKLTAIFGWNSAMMSIWSHFFTLCHILRFELLLLLLDLFWFLVFLTSLTNLRHMTAFLTGCTVERIRFKLTLSNFMWPRTTKALICLFYLWSFCLWTCWALSTGRRMNFDFLC